MAHQTMLRILQLSVMKIVEYDESQRFSNPIFDNFYPNVCSSLNKSQRASYEKIDQMLKASNRLHEQQAICAEKIARQSSSYDWGWWRKMARFQYLIFNEVSFLINHHLTNPDSPAIVFGERSHRDYLKHEQWLRDEIEKIVEGAKTIDPRLATITYDPDMFTNLDDEIPD